jgi:hypothetical protein
MALDITAVDITVDETAGLQDDDTSASNSTVTYLLGLNAAPTLSATQVAFKADFITASATGNDSFSSVTLTQSIGGAAFSTTVGVNSNLRTVDGNYVWLFKDPGNSSVVIGVIGTSDPAAAPNLSNPYTVAFALALVNSTTTTPDLYTAQYVPLLHPLTNNPDDRIDLTNKVFASLSATTTVSFTGANAASGNPDFYIINSPTDATKQVLVIGQGGTANVSTQGFGIGNQSINPTETLQVDFVTGGTLASGTASQIAYGSHIEDVTKVGFTINQITPSSPDKRVDITITALNATGNEQGTDFYDGTPANAVDITSIKLTGASGYASTITADGTYATPSGDVIITGLSGTGNAVTIEGLDNVTTVDFTTATPIDRLLVTGVDANEGCDITEFHFQTTTPNAHTEEVGSFINFDDDGPSVGAVASTNFVQHDETPGLQNGGADAADKDIAGNIVVFGTSTIASLFGGITSSGDPDVASKDLGNAIGYARSGGSLLDPPTGSYGADGAGSTVYALSVAPGGVDSGVETTSGVRIFLYAGSGTTAGLILGRIGNDVIGGPDTPNSGGAIAFALAVNPGTGEAFIAQYLSLKHGNTSSFDETINLLAASVQMSVTRTDKDGDSVSDRDNNVGDLFKFDDDGPTLTINTGVSVSSAAVTEASGVGGQSQATVTAPTITASGADGVTSNTTYALSLAGTATGLQTTAGNFPITLVADSTTQISGKYDSNGDTTLDATAFTVVLSNTTVTLTSLVALEHDNTQGAGEVNTLNLNGLINLVATVATTDGDGDTTSSQSTTASALSLTFNDTDPVITQAFDADGAAGIQSPETLANTLNATASGLFGHSMVDQIAAGAYNVTTGVSDFVDVDAVTAGVQIGLTGSVSNQQNSGITQAVATLVSEDLNSAVFNFSFHYDYDPITAGVQDATAGGTLTFNKATDAYTFQLTDIVDGFSFDVLHTAALVAKAPTGNTGHPLIVAEQLTQNADPNPFFVQFTANSVTQQIGFGFNATGDVSSGGTTPSDTTFTGSAHDMIANTNEDWVSATQLTNGVAGDTIQKGECLTLRFFNANMLTDVNPKSPGGGTEQLDPTGKASGIVVKFDGIGNSEDLIIILDLKAADGTEITRAINVENSDLIRGNGNIPAPYNTEFTLDNNDALLIIEQNDYTVAGETYQIQGIQIMQSANGLTGQAIDLNGATGATGGSSATSGLTAWDVLDQDVLKIVDIGFIQQTSGTIGASLDFAFNIVDGDADQTATQHILLDIGAGSGSGSSLAAASMSSFSAAGLDPLNSHYASYDYLLL